MSRGQHFNVVTFTRENYVAVGSGVRAPLDLAARDRERVTEMSRSLVVRVALTLLVLIHAGVASAQSAGSLRGTVADTTGAVLPGATVTLTNEATKFTRNATSDAKGTYFFATVDPGSYTLKVELSGFKTHEAKERAITLLSRVGLSERLNHLPDELSGGEQQRVAIARALANHPKLILADEPTGELDTTTGAETVRTLYELAKQEDTAVLTVTHDPVVAEKADELYEMRDGQLHASHRARESYRIQAVEQVPSEPRTSLSQPN